MRAEVYQAKDILTKLLHTIFFHRALGVVTPMELPCQNLQTTYLTCGDKKVHHDVDQLINSLEGKVEERKESLVDVTLAFYTLREKNALLGWKKTQEKVVWERWVIPIVLCWSPSGHIDSAEEKKLQEIESAVTEQVLFILQKVEENKDHLPPMHGDPRHSSAPMQCLYDLSIPEKSGSNWPIDMFKMINPPTILN